MDLDSVEKPVQSYLFHNLKPHCSIQALWDSRHLQYKTIRPFMQFSSSSGEKSYLVFRGLVKQVTNNDIWDSLLTTHLTWKQSSVLQSQICFPRKYSVDRRVATIHKCNKNCSLSENSNEISHYGSILDDIYVFWVATTNVLFKVLYDAR